MPDLDSSPLTTDSPSAALWRLSRASMRSASRLYTGPAVYSQFPKHLGFAVFAFVWMVASYALYALMGGTPPSTIGINLLMMTLFGLTGVAMPSNRQWACATFFVITLGYVVSMPFALIDFFAHGSWLGQAAELLTLLWGSWMMVTAVRLMIARIAQANRDYPLK